MVVRTRGSISARAVRPSGRPNGVPQLTRVLRGMRDQVADVRGRAVTARCSRSGATGADPPRALHRNARSSPCSASRTGRLPASAGSGNGREQHGSEWLFVTGYQIRKRPFYTHPDPKRPEHSRSFDLLFRGTELVTGDQRRHASYLEAREARGMTSEPIAAYLEAFRHGCLAQRLRDRPQCFLMQLLDLPDIRLVVLFPRNLTRLSR